MKLLCWVIYRDGSFKLEINVPQNTKILSERWSDGWVFISKNGWYISTYNKAGWTLKVLNLAKKLKKLLKIMKFLLNAHKSTLGMINKKKI